MVFSSLDKFFDKQSVSRFSFIFHKCLTDRGDKNYVAPFN